ncbi:tRNA modification GTPase, partial [Negativicoccus succinicivorans]
VWKEGLKTVIAGLPNAGKSSLLNQLLAEERAIVTDIPGTTRDTITESALIHGIPLVLVDTAGIREASDQIEQMGIARTHRELAQADLILAVLDTSQPLTAETRAWLATLQNKAAILLLNKTDLPLQADLAEVTALTGAIPQVAIAARTGTGMDDLGNALATYVEQHQLQAGADSVLLTNVRQEDLARRALASLRSAQQGLHEGLMEDLITEDLRAAWDALGAIVGRNPEASITDEIFRRFCVGK